jgi:hypothetical protein
VFSCRPADRNYFPGGFSYFPVGSWPWGKYWFLVVRYWSCLLFNPPSWLFEISWSQFFFWNLALILLNDYMQLPSVDLAVSFI